MLYHVSSRTNYLLYPIIIHKSAMFPVSVAINGLHEIWGYHRSHVKDSNLLDVKLYLVASLPDDTDENTLIFPVDFTVTS